MTRQWVAHPGSVAIVAHDGEHVWLVRQPREATGDPDLLELPAGKLDEEGESPLECGQRELAEEIGKAAASWEHLTTYFTSAGFTDEQCHIFLATDLRDEPGRRDRGRADRHRAASARTSSTRRSRSAATRRRSSGCSCCAPSRRAEPRLAPAGLAPPARRNPGARGHRYAAPAPRPDRAPPFEHLLLDFLAYLEFERGLSRNTLEAYRSDLLQFGEWLGRSGHDPLAIGHAELSAFAAEIAGGREDKPPAAPATLQRKIACLRSFYRHLRRTSRARDRSDREPARAQAEPQAAAGAQPRRGRRAAAPAARDRAGGAARPRAAGDDVRVRAARVRGDRARGRRRRPRGRDPARARQGLEGAARADRLGGRARARRLPPARARRASSATAGSRACSSTSAAAA